MASSKTESEYRNSYLLAGIATGSASREEIDELQTRLNVQLPTSFEHTYKFAV